MQPAAAFHLVAAAGHLRPIARHHIQLLFSYMFQALPDQHLCCRFFHEASLAEQSVPCTPIFGSQSQRQQQLCDRMPPKRHHLGYHQGHHPLIDPLLSEVPSVGRQQPKQILD
jgi:hypothetical protein